MYINSVSQSNQTNFNGYVYLKQVGKGFVKAKKGMPGTIGLFVAGGKKIDEQVLAANKKLLKSSRQIKQTEPVKQGSVAMFFKGVLSALGLTNF